MAVEVWVDVLGFIKRIQLARRICLINWKIYEICWPRLHGNKVMAHRVQDIVIGYEDESAAAAAAAGHQPTAVLMMDNKKVPFPECPMPGYITGFKRIQINFLDSQVWAFLSLIAPGITANSVQIQFAMKMSLMDENQLASVNGLIQLFREKVATIMFWRCLSNIQFLPNCDNKLKKIDSYGIEESDIPILLEFLASARPDGQQRVMEFYNGIKGGPAVQKLLDAIIVEFRTSTLPVPQPFCLNIKTNLNLNIWPYEEQNPQTDETLTIVPDPNNRKFAIFRHPRGQYEQWAEDARNRLIDMPNNSVTRIFVDIAEFGMMPFCSP